MPFKKRLTQIFSAADCDAILTENGAVAWLKARQLKTKLSSSEEPAGLPCAGTNWMDPLVSGCPSIRTWPETFARSGRPSPHPRISARHIPALERIALVQEESLCTDMERALIVFNR